MNSPFDVTVLLSNFNISINNTNNINNPKQELHFFLSFNYKIASKLVEPLVYALTMS